MKHVPLSTLEGLIVRPGLEKHLVPLMHFRGHADLGRFHRMWNLTSAMMASECDGFADGYARLWGNPEFSQLCFPDKRPSTTAFYGFLSRLQAKPEVADEQPGLLEYARYLMPRPFQLDPVSPFATRNRHAWWRTFESKMPAWRALQAERRALRLAVKLKEKQARADARIAARAERLALINAQREAARADRARRRLERERAAREPRKFVLREGAAPIVYPFLIHDGGRPEHDLLRAINAAVPRGIMGDLRADICQDLAVGVLCGDFTQDDLRLPAKEMIGRIRRMFPEKYGPLSLDAIMPGTDDFRLIDTI